MADSNWEDALIHLHEMGWDTDDIDSACEALVEACREGIFEGNEPSDLDGDQLKQILGNDMSTSEQEAVVSLDPDGLDRGGRNSRLVAHGLVQPSGSRDHGVVVRRVDDRALAHGVVHDDQRARTTQVECVPEVVGVVLLVGVDEAQIERPAQGGKRVERSADLDLHLVRNTSTFEILTGYSGVFR